MKISAEIPDELLDDGCVIATREGTTLSALAEEGLRRVIAAREPVAPFRLRDASFKGEGLQEHLEGAGWDQIRDIAYGLDSR